MNFSRPAADIFLPLNDGVSAAQALQRTTHLCVAAHQDDIEIMAHHGIAQCHGRADRFFTGVVVTNGAGSPRAGAYAAFTDEQMLDVRRLEQRRAAELGKYNLMLQLAHPSAEVKTSRSAGVRADLMQLFAACAPQVVYLHQPADKHDTHVAVLLRCLEAMRTLAKERRPRRVLGCEVWRDLDWLDDADKVALDVSGLPELAPELIKVFDSQVAGGKRYDIAAIGRRQANATFHTSHATDRMSAVSWAMDLTPLVADETLAVSDFTQAHIERLRADVASRIARLR
jgi:LmbE family N-acetylglucosaminyl deacetylase